MRESARLSDAPSQPAQARADERAPQGDAAQPVTSLLDHEQIETTDAKAKVLRRLAEQMITLGKRGTCTRGAGRCP